MRPIEIQDIERLIDKFKLERFAYLILTVLSALTIMGIGLFLLLSGQGDYKLFLSLLAPTGTLTLCIFRVLKMWDDVLKIITTSKTGTDDEVR